MTSTIDVWIRVRHLSPAEARRPGDRHGVPVSVGAGICVGVGVVLSSVTG